MGCSEYKFIEAPNILCIHKLYRKSGLWLIGALCRKDLPIVSALRYRVHFDSRVLILTEMQALRPATQTIVSSVSVGRGELLEPGNLLYILIESEVDNQVNWLRKA